MGKSDLTDEHLVSTYEGVVYARSVRRLAEHSWSEDNFRAGVVTPQKPKTTTADITPAAGPLAPHAPQEEPEDGEEEPTAEPEEDEEIWTQKRHQECRAQAEARSAQKHKRK